MRGTDCIHVARLVIMYFLSVSWACKMALINNFVLKFPGLRPLFIFERAPCPRFEESMFGLQHCANKPNRQPICKSTQFFSRTNFVCLLINCTCNRRKRQSTQSFIVNDLETLFSYMLENFCYFLYETGENDFSLHL